MPRVLQIKQQNAEQEPSSFVKYPALVASGAIEGLGLPGSLLNAVGSAVGSLKSPSEGQPLPQQIQQAPQPSSFDPGVSGEAFELPTMQDLKKYVTEPLFGKEYTTPKGTMQELAKSVGQGLPFSGAASAITKAPLAGTILRDVGSAVGSKIAEGTGFGFVGQLIGGALGSKGVDKILQKFWTPQSLQDLPQAITQASKQLYDAEKQIGSSIIANTPTYENQLNKISTDVMRNTSLNSADKKQLLERIAEFKQTAERGVASEIFQRKKELNEILRGAMPKVERGYYQELRDATFDALESIGKENPQWNNIWKSADRLQQAQNYKFGLTSMAEEIPALGKLLQKNPLIYGTMYALADSLLGLNPMASFYKGGAIATAGGAYNQLQQLTGYMLKPETRKLLADSMVNVAKRNASGLVRNVKDLIEIEKKDEKKVPIKIRNKYQGNLIAV